MNLSISSNILSLKKAFLKVLATEGALSMAKGKLYRARLNLYKWERNSWICLSSAGSISPNLHNRTASAGILHVILIFYTSKSVKTTWELPVSWECRSFDGEAWRAFLAMYFIIMPILSCSISTCILSQPPHSCMNCFLHCNEPCICSQQQQISVLCSHFTLWWWSKIWK